MFHVYSLELESAFTSQEAEERNVVRIRLDQTAVGY